MWDVFVFTFLPLEAFSMNLQILRQKLITIDRSQHPSQTNWSNCKKEDLDGRQNRALRLNFPNWGHLAHLAKPQTPRYNLNLSLDQMIQSRRLGEELLELKTAESSRMWGIAIFLAGLSLPSTPSPNSTTT